MKYSSYFPVTIEDGVTLRPVRGTDAQAIYKAIDKSRTHLSPWLPWVEKTNCVDDSRDFLMNAETEYKQGTALHLGVFRKTTDEMETCLGVVAFREIKTFQRCGVFGFWMSIDGKGRGLCTRACSALIEYGKTIGLRTFEIHCDRSNKKSRNVAKRLKFRENSDIECNDFPEGSKHVSYSLDSHNDCTMGRYDPLSLVCVFFGLALAVVVGSCGLLVKAPGEAPAPPMRGKHLLLVSGGWNYTIQSFWYKKAQELGIALSVADNVGHYAREHATTGLLHSFHPVDLFSGEKELAKQLVNILGGSGIDFSGILTFKDAYLVAVSLAAKQVGLPTLDPDIFRTIRDKGAIREVIGSKVPFARISSIDDVTRAAKAVGFPCVLKPSFGEGSLAVIRVPTFEKLHEAYKTVSASLPKLKNVIGGIPEILIEREIVGTEHDINIVVENGRLLHASIHDELPMTAPWFQETGLVTPSKLDAASQTRVVDFVTDLLRKTGITTGVYHLEFIYTKHGPELLEINGRLGGFLNTHVIEEVYGVDHVKLAYTLAAGVLLPPLPTSGVLVSDKPSRVVIIMYPNVPFTGYVNNTDYMKQLQQDPRIKVAQRMVNVGQKVYGADVDRPWMLGMFMFVDSGPIRRVERDAETLYKSVDWGSYLTKSAPSVNLAVANTPVPGMEDIYGLPRRRFQVVSRLLEGVSYQFGFDEVQVPLVERASTFSEDIVGQSPWPEWDPRGCFFFDVEDYNIGFKQLLGKTPVILVPEGTLSVARWLGRQIASNRDALAFPLKIFYNMPCFRNEPVDTLSGRKKRQFDQFGVEILGTRHLGADVEIIWMLGRMMEAIGIPKSAVIARVSNVQILIQLLKDSKIAHPDDVRIKEAMDEIAECRAKGVSDCVAKNEAAFWRVLGRYESIPEELLRAWRTMLHHSSGVVDAALRKGFPASYAPLFDELEDISGMLLKYGVRIVADLCVVRSHEYYTHFSFEVDVILNGKRYLEVAGGGRYDKLVGHFVQQHDNDINIVPSTGFAFGMQRVIGMLEDANIFQTSDVWRTASLTPALDDSTADYLLVPNHKCGDAGGYLGAQQWLVAKSGLNVTQVRVDTYIGDGWAGSGAPSATRDGLVLEYQKKHNIKKILYSAGVCPGT